MDSLLYLDTQLFKLINGLELGFVDQILVLVRNKFTWIPLYIFMISFFIYRWGRRSWLPILFTLLTVGICDTVSSQLIKKNVERVRPCRTMQVQERVHCGSGYSFTSSHATNHMGLAVFWFQLLGVWGNKRWWLIFWAFMIGFCQIFVGVHYPFDVLTGFLLGTAVAMGTYFLYQKIYPRLKE
ncbi:phosphatase PAP2 family protein [Membranihabitans maritimus]|uniref:phosphatase PAP2 family protein n=1 Tax=Membranihabitans maritimus TaxID=2904244 RepID=UPI001F20D997|nr:phosphatase PAP2 family protein [Membranihabitans maritimus]